MTATKSTTDGANSLEHDAWPVGFVARSGRDDPHGERSYRCEVMGLSGLQKEGLVEDLTTGRTWRLASDEGAYLNGTDLAPAPLMHWAAGVLADIAESILLAGRTEGVTMSALDVTSTQEFGLDGSFVKAEAVAMAGDLDLVISVSADASDQQVDEIVARGLRASAAAGGVTAAVEGTLALSVNGRLSVIESDPAEQDAVAERGRAEQDPFRRYTGRPAPEAGMTPPHEVVVKLRHLQRHHEPHGAARPGPNPVPGDREDHVGAIGATADRLRRVPWRRDGAMDYRLRPVRSRSAVAGGALRHRRGLLLPHSARSSPQSATRPAGRGEAGADERD